MYSLAGWKVKDMHGVHAETSFLALQGHPTFQMSEPPSRITWPPSQLFVQHFLSVRDDVV